MSDMTFTAHMLACDWPECDQTTDPDSRDGDWLHTEDGRDYCADHWHEDQQWHPKPGIPVHRMPGPAAEEES